MFERQLALDIARILSVMSDPPNARSKPIEGDLQGDFDIWFDGGDVKHDTGMSTYRFLDGTSAVTGTSLMFSVVIRFPDGTLVQVLQKDDESLRPAELLGPDGE